MSVVLKKIRNDGEWAHWAPAEKYPWIYICSCPFEDKDIPKTAGFSWHRFSTPRYPRGRRAWWTYEVEKAAKLAEYADASCREELEPIRKRLFRSLTLSKQAAADIDHPHPDGLDYYPFQKAGIQYAVERKCTLLADEMGLGKTIQGIGLINLKKDIKTVLVICPASLRKNWEIETMRWLVKDDRTWNIAIGTTVTMPTTENGFNFVITNYEAAKKHAAALSAIEWDLLIVDEVHKLKNPKAQRTKAVFGYGKENRGIQARYKIGMTGTPIVNRPSELFGIISWLDPAWRGKWKFYMSRYCNYQRTRWGTDIKGANEKTLPELQERLRSSIMIRRLKKDVLIELPAKRRQVIELPANGCAEYINREHEAEARNAERRYELEVAVELAKVSDDEDAYRDAVRQLTQFCGGVEFSEMAKLRHETAMAKVPYVVEHARAVVDGGEKAVIFAHHHDVVNKLAEAFKGECVVLTGDDPPASKIDERQRRIDLFQGHDKIRVFIGSITAAGVGLTLTASSTVIFAEEDWVPGNITQAEDRCHRIGQRDSVLVQHLVLEGSLDAHMAQTIIEKQKNADLALDKDLPEPVTPSRHVKVSRTKVMKEAIEHPLTPDQVQAVHSALQELAAMCDGARREDFAGFNKIDSAIGKSLAGSPELTMKQAILGKRIVLKYHRQLSEGLMEIIKNANSAQAGGRCGCTRWG